MYSYSEVKAELYTKAIRFNGFYSRLCLNEMEKYVVTTYQTVGIIKSFIFLILRYILKLTTENVERS